MPSSRDTAPGPLISSLRAWRWPALAAAGVLVLFVGLTAHGGLWRTFGVQPMRPMFADWVNVLSSAETHAAGGNPYVANPPDPHGRLFSYGPWWLVLGPAGFTRDDAWWLGVLLVLGFTVTAAAVLRPDSPAETAWFVLLVGSPPLLLGLERGNSDLVIFVLLALAAWCVGRRHAVADAGALGLLVTAAALKFYPLAALGALGAGRGRWTARFGWMLAGIALFAAAWWAQRDSYALALREAIRPLSPFTYGLPVAATMWERLADHRAVLLLTGLPVLAWGGVRLWRARAALPGLFPLHGGRAAAAVAGTACWLLCYALTVNFQYRAALALCAVPFLLASPATRWLVAWFAVTLWLAAPLFWFAPPGLDPEWWRFAAAVSGVQQAALFTFSAALAAALGGWTWRRLKAPATAPTP